MSQNYILMRPLIRFVRVEANLEKHFGFTALVIEKPLIVGSDVATEAVLVGQSVADLAGNFVLMNSM